MMFKNITGPYKFFIHCIRTEFHIRRISLCKRKFSVFIIFEILICCISHDDITENLNSITTNSPE